VFFFQAEDGIRGLTVTGVQTCALPISVIVPIAAGTAPAAIGTMTGHPSRTTLTRRAEVNAATSTINTMNAVVVHHERSTEVISKIGRASCRERVESTVVASGVGNKYTG